VSANQEGDYTLSDLCGVNNASEACLASRALAADSQYFDLQNEDFILLDKIV
jgi:hypothetical protein